MRRPHNPPAPRQASQDIIADFLCSILGIPSPLTFRKPALDTGFGLESALIHNKFREWLLYWQKFCYDEFH